METFSSMYCMYLDECSYTRSGKQSVFLLCGVWFSEEVRSRDNFDCYLIVFYFYFNSTRLMGWNTKGARPAFFKLFTWYEMQNHTMLFHLKQLYIFHSMNCLRIAKFIKWTGTFLLLVQPYIMQVLICKVIIRLLLFFCFFFK